MQENKNLILAFVLSLIILVGFDQFYMRPAREHEAARQAEQAQLQEGKDVATPQVGAGTLPDANPAAVLLTRDQALAQSDRVAVKTPKLTGSIALKGARIDDLILTGYKETLDKNSPYVTLFSPSGSEHAYFAEFGWAAAGAGVTMPTADTLWQADATALTPEKPVTLTWESPEGLLFTRVISVDQDYMFTVVQKVENKGNVAAVLAPYGLISRQNTPQISKMFVLHEGAIGVFGETLVEIDYADLRDDSRHQENGTGGWLGLTDKYWLAALVPDQSKAFEGRFSHRNPDQVDRYQVDYKLAAMPLAPGATIESTDRLFAGAKVVTILDSYEEKLGISRFDYGVDWGWFYWITKPIFYVLHTFNLWFGNFGLAILALTVLIKLAFFPLANKSYTAMSKMKLVQPKMKQLQERYKDDKMRLQQELMELYKKEKINPMAGCLPILVQIPVFFALYKVLYVTIEMRHAPFFGWVKDLSAPDPLLVTNLFGLIPWNPPTFIALGIWPILMGLTMWFQQKLNPAPTDPIQAKVLGFLPIIFTFILAPFSVGLVIYWTWNNILSILQQWVIMKRMGVKVG